MKKFSFALLLSAVFLGGCQVGDLPEAVDDFDVVRYCGKWYEIARLPNWFEDGMTGVTAEYTLIGKNKIKVVNRGWKNGQLREITGWARPVNHDGTGLLEVSFFRPFYAPYVVIKIAPDYSYSVVSGSGRSYLWILARTPRLDDKVLEEILNFIRSRGYDSSRLIMFNGG